MWDIVDGLNCKFTKLISISIISIVLVSVSWFGIINLLISTIILSNPKILILLKLFGHKQLLIIKRRQIINLYFIMILINITFEIGCALFFMMIFGRIDGFCGL